MMKIFRKKIFLVPIVNLFLFTFSATTILSQVSDDNKIRVILLGSNGDELNKNLNFNLRMILNLEKSIDLIPTEEAEKYFSNYNIDSLIESPSKKIFFEICEISGAEYLFYNNIKSENENLISGVVGRFDKSTLENYPLKFKNKSPNSEEILKQTQIHLIEPILPETKQKLNSWPTWLISGITIVFVFLILYGVAGISADGKNSPQTDPV